MSLTFIKSFFILIRTLVLVAQELDFGQDSHLSIEL